jgi:hypothetical protein
MIIGTYLSQEGFSEKRGTWYSRELNATITSTGDNDFFNVTVEEHTYKDIHLSDISKVVDHCHNYTGTSLLVLLYNMQKRVKNNSVLAIKEDI